MTAAWDDEAEFEILCGGEWMAVTCGPRESAMKKAFQYAVHYAAGGPVIINEIVRRKDKLVRIKVDFRLIGITCGSAHDER